MQRNILVLICGFLCGSVFSVFSNSIFLIFSSLSISILVFIYSKLFTKENVYNFGIFITIFLIAFSFGQMRFYFFEKNIDKSLTFYENKKIEFEGFVFKESESDGVRQKIFVQIEKIKEGNVFNKKEGRVLVFGNLYPRFEFGDKVSGFGKISLPEVIENKDGSYFNYPKYLEKDKIVAILNFGNITKISSSKGLFGYLYSIKNSFKNALSKTLKEPELSLGFGIVFGGQSISREISEIFRISGLSHIIVLSGYNITILSESIYKIFLPISSYAGFFSIFSIILFVISSGASATSIRAGIMAILVLLSRRFGKSYSVSKALLVAVVLVVLYNPFIFIYDPSFHLSLIATISVVYLTPVIYKKIDFITDKFSLRDVFATTISAQIFVLPYIIFMTGKVSLYSFFSNILVLPFVPISMFLGFYSGVLAFMSKYLSLIFAIPLNFLLKYFIFIANLFAKMPFSQINLPIPSIWLVFIFYTITIFVLYRFSNKD